MRVQRALVCVTDHLSRRNRHVLAVSLKPRMTDILAIQIESGLLRVTTREWKLANFILRTRLQYDLEGSKNPL
ncbi:hypothetical protein, partial [Gluconobacter potus]|uniref:hypothetical protein n=1 Tax=Gluconobacter potus TaxID=2724927 RepID=UPI001E3B48F3